MFKIKINKLEKLKESNKDIKSYLLKTNEKDIKLSVTNDNIEKQTILEYINCPFFIITEKNNNTITPNDYFEISNDESTIDLEITQSCGLDYHI